MKTLCDYCKNGNRETKQCYLGGMDICKGELFEAPLQQTEPITTDEAGHHSEWKYCPGCGFDWDIQMGADQFGCWNCGFIRKQQ